MNFRPAALAPTPNLLTGRGSGVLAIDRFDFLVGRGVFVRRVFVLFEVRTLGFLGSPLIGVDWLFDVIALAVVSAVTSGSFVGDLPGVLNGDRKGLLSVADASRRLFLGNGVVIVMFNLLQLTISSADSTSTGCVYAVRREYCKVLTS